MLTKLYKKAKEKKEPVHEVMLASEKFGKIVVEENPFGTFTLTGCYKEQNTLASCKADILCIGRYWHSTLIVAVINCRAL